MFDDMIWIPTTTRVAAIVIFVTGCSVFSGVTRSLQLESPLASNCVDAALRSVPEILDVRYERREGSRPLTLTGVKPPNQDDFYEIRTETTRSRLVVSTDYRGRVRYSHTLPAMPDEHQARVDEIRPVMRNIELAIEKSCGIPDLASSIRESCPGVTCSELP